MFFDDINSERCLSLLLDEKEKGIIITAINISLDFNSKKEETKIAYDDKISVRYLKSLESLQYELHQPIQARFFFFREKYCELFKIQKKNYQDINFEIPFIIALNIYYGAESENFTILKYKVIGISSDNTLNLILNENPSFTEINYGNGNLEIIKRERLEERLKEIKESEEVVKRMKNI